MAPKKLSSCFDYLVLRQQLSDITHALYWSNLQLPVSVQLSITFSDFTELYLSHFKRQDS